MSQRVVVCGEVKPEYRWSRSESESERAIESHTGDPKPGDLTMSRVKRAEYVRGGPNPGLLQKAGMTCGKR